jgi:hypothetical protein
MVSQLKGYAIGRLSEDRSEPARSLIYSASSDIVWLIYGGLIVITPKNLNALFFVCALLLCLSRFDPSPVNNNRKRASE